MTNLLSLLAELEELLFSVDKDVYGKGLLNKIHEQLGSPTWPCQFDNEHRRLTRVREIINELKSLATKEAK